MNGLRTPELDKFLPPRVSGAGAGALLGWGFGVWGLCGFGALIFKVPGLYGQGCQAVGLDGLLPPKVE